jgi:hypothetical protein
MPGLFEIRFVMAAFGGRRDTMKFRSASALSIDQPGISISKRRPNSLMHWLSQVPLIRELGSSCEVHAQFELGKYLKQLDPSYNHPEYRVDFLIKISNGEQRRQLVLEYDGFEFHFEKGVAAGLINESTWRAYLSSEDLEREKVLESFGVKMIR